MLLINAIAMCEEVTATGLPVTVSMSLFINVNSSITVTVSVWPNNDKRIVRPIEGNTYVLDGKLSTKEGLLFVEALRLIPIEFGGAELFSPRVSGSALLTAKTESTLSLRSGCYAAGVGASIDVVCLFATTQYRQMINSMKAEKDVDLDLSGIVTSWEGNTLSLMNCDISYHTKPEVVKVSPGSKSSIINRFAKKTPVKAPTVIDLTDSDPDSDEKTPAETVDGKSGESPIRPLKRGRKSRNTVNDDE
jgi:hypothetical protein